MALFMDIFIKKSNILHGILEHAFTLPGWQWLNTLIGLPIATTVGLTPTVFSQQQPN
jgi:hypothetical protein